MVLFDMMYMVGRRVGQTIGRNKLTGSPGKLLSAPYRVVCVFFIIVISGAVSGQIIYSLGLNATTSQMPYVRAELQEAINLAD